GAWWPQDTDVVPVRTDHDTDPLRALIAAGATVTSRDHACVQVLARPATAARLRAARRTAAARAGTRPAGAAGLPADGGTALAAGVVRLLVEPLIWLLEVFLPGRPTRTAPGRSAGDRGRDPIGEAGRRPVVEKVTG